MVVLSFTRYLGLVIIALVLSIIIFGVLFLINKITSLKIPTKKNLMISTIIFILVSLTLIILGTLLSKPTPIRGDIFNTMEKQVIEEIRSSNERMVFNEIDIDVKKAEKKVLFYGIKNDLSVETTFNIDVNCNKDIHNSPDYVSPVTFETFEQRTIKAGEIDILKMNVIVSSEATPNTHVCHMGVVCVTAVDTDVLADCSDGEGLEGNDPVDAHKYAEKNFFVTVLDR